MLYTNYKQIAEITLNSKDAEIVEKQENVPLLIAQKGYFFQDRDKTLSRVNGVSETYLTEEIPSDMPQTDVEGFSYHVISVANPTAILPNQYILINNELFYVYRLTADNKLACGRARKDTVAADHAKYAPVYLEQPSEPARSLYDFIQLNDFNQKYRFKIDLNNRMSTNVRIAVKSFILHRGAQVIGWTSNSYDHGTREIGDVYIDNMYDKNSFHSDPKIRNKFHLLSTPICFDNIEKYHNNDILNTSKSIQNISFQNNYFDIIVDAKIRDKDQNKILGCPIYASWSLTLIVYDTEFEENPKAENYGKMPIMPPKILN
jgi:hypothetical protein